MTPSEILKGARRMSRRWSMKRNSPSSVALTVMAVALLAGVGIVALVSPGARATFSRLIGRLPELPAGAPGNEGEGSKSADRRYRDATARYVDAGKVPSAAAAARRAIDGPEGPELRKAEAEGKSRAAT